MGRYTGPVERLSRREGVELYLKGERALNGKSAPGRGAARRRPASTGRPASGALDLRHPAAPEAAAQALLRRARAAAQALRARGDAAAARAAWATTCWSCSSGGWTTSSTGSASPRPAPKPASSSSTATSSSTAARSTSRPTRCARAADRDPPGEPGRPRRPGRARPQRPRAGLAGGRRRRAVGPRAARAAPRRDPDAGRGAAHRRVLRTPVTDFARLAATPCTDHAALSLLLARELGHADGLWVARRGSRRSPAGCRTRTTPRPSCTGSAGCWPSTCPPRAAARCCCPTRSRPARAIPRRSRSRAPASPRAAGIPVGIVGHGRRLYLAHEELDGPFIVDPRSRSACSTPAPALRPDPGAARTRPPTRCSSTSPSAPSASWTSRRRWRARRCG